MSVVDLLVYKSNLSNGIIGSLDPRTKLFLSLSLAFSLIIFQNLWVVGFLFILVFGIQILLIGLQTTLKKLYFLKFSIILIAIFSILFSFSSSQSLEKSLLFTVVLIGRVLGVMFAFSIFNQTTSPDALYDALIKLKLPSSISWKIVLSYRQSIFFLEELTQISQMLNQQNNNYFQKVRNYSKLLTMAYVRGIIRSEALAQTLVIRGFQKPHKHLALLNSKLKLIDYVLIILILIFDIFSIVLKYNIIL